MAVDDLKQIKQLNLVTMIASAFGIFGSVLCILLYHFSRRFQIPMARLMYYLAWTYLVSAVCMLAGPIAARDPFSSFCKSTGLLLQLSDFLAVTFMFYIGLGLVLVTFRGWKPVDARNLDNKFLSGGILLSLVISLPWVWYSPGLALRPVYFSDTTWCWISKTYPGIRAGILYAPMLLVLVFDTIVFAVVGVRIWHNSREKYTKNEKVRDAVHMYILSSLAYLFLFSLSWIPTSISVILHFIRGYSTFGQIMIRASLFPLRGLIHFVLYTVLVAIAGQLHSKSDKIDREQAQ